MMLQLILMGVLGSVPPTCGGSAPEVRPQVDLVFVLDTTGSMGGLIEGAKRRIWSIANQIALGKPTPALRIGLVGYRDKGDDYVTKLSPLTDDLDDVYAELQGFGAVGGGDTPENVRQALHDALTKLEWSQDKRALKILFLVGDCPPHMDYDDVPDLADLCKTAASSEIIINTVRCGSNPETGRIWEEIALKAEGKFMTIDQSGGVVSVPTPFDDDLGRYSDELGKAVIPYGDPRAREKEEKRKSDAEAMESGSKADRVSALARLGRGATLDLVQAVLGQGVDLETIKDEHLPEEMREMTLQERREQIGKMGKLQEELRQKVRSLSKSRDAYIRAELEKTKGQDAFDEAVTKALREQAKAKGIHFDKDD